VFPTSLIPHDKTPFFELEDRAGLFVVTVKHKLEAVRLGPPGHHHQTLYFVVMSVMMIVEPEDVTLVASAWMCGSFKLMPVVHQSLLLQCLCVPIIELFARGEGDN